MIKQTKIFYNFVIDSDLFYTIYDYLRFNGQTIRDHNNIHSLYDFDNLSIDNIKQLANDAINWLQNIQLKNVYKINFDDNSPSSNTWGTLYYQTLNYMAIVGAEHSIRMGDLATTIEWCKRTIDYLFKLIDEIREPNDEDLNNI